MQALQRATEDLDAGRLWKARDRLRGAFVSDPANQEVLELLGEVLYRMGDLPEAARYWLLTDRDDEAARGAYEALRERYRARSLLIASAIPVRAELEAFPASVSERLRSIERAAREEAGRSVDLGWGRRPRSATLAVERTWRNRVGDAIGAALLFLFVAAVLLGLIAIAREGVKLLFSFFD